ncbi:MAG: preprotein translocase subunit SecG [Synergistaceae bacterium]|jgi:preprotein translocase subunit SecG|nr:preprotein translocase subunit SecG [Synergistaceae bacterium]
MGNVVAVLFLVLCVALIAVILMQHRKSGGFSGSFGGGGTQMDMSGGSWQRMSSMTKLTVVLAVAYMALSLLLVYAVKP